jgi:hypothetical protein
MEEDIQISNGEENIIDYSTDLLEGMGPNYIFLSTGDSLSREIIVKSCL